MGISRIIESARRNFYSPSWYKKRLSIRKGLMPLYFHLTAGEGVHIVEEDWDNLVILDACRFDIFEEHNTIEGEFSKRRSVASSTPSFLRENFGEEQHHDIVYVTANPQVNYWLDESQFHAVVNVWDTGWDDQKRTVMPEHMMNATIEALETYANKRIISHFVQPHFPFIGPTAERELGEQGGFATGRARVSDISDPDTSDYPEPWTMLENGAVDMDTVWDSYVECLTETLPYIKDLVESLQGKTVITADHGNMAGEYAWPFPVRIYGHPGQILTDELVTIPWLEIDGERREITAEPPNESLSVDVDADVASRLEELGYVDI
jgi:hypothetical protein